MPQASGPAAGEGLAHVAEQELAAALPERFGRASLSIDDCLDLEACYDPPFRPNAGPIVRYRDFPGGHVGMCWNWSSLLCEPCSGLGRGHYDDHCNGSMTACSGLCFARYPRGPVPRRRAAPSAARRQRQAMTSEAASGFGSGPSPCCCPPASCALGGFKRRTIWPEHDADDGRADRGRDGGRTYPPASCLVDPPGRGRVATIDRPTVGRAAMMNRLAAFLVALVALVVGCGLFAGGSVVARQGASPTAEGTPGPDDQPPLPGAVASAERSFRVAGARFVGTLFFGFMVVEFDTEAHAATGTPVLIDRLETTPGFRDLDGASAPSIGDESFVFAGKVDADDITLDVGAVVVRAGRFVYLGFAIGAAATPLSDLVPIAQRTIGPDTGTPPPPRRTPHRCSTACRASMTFPRGSSWMKSARRSTRLRRRPWRPRNRSPAGGPVLAPGRRALLSTPAVGGDRLGSAHADRTGPRRPVAHRTDVSRTCR